MSSVVDFKAMVTWILEIPCSYALVMCVLEGGFGFVPGARDRLWT